jgi:hypothetical protein
MTTRKRSRLLLATVVGMVALVLAQTAPGLARTNANTHKPPYKKGAQGGDEWNYLYADPSDGTVRIVRAYPEYNPFTCTDSKGGYITLRAVHDVTGPVASVEIRYEDAGVDPYAFLTASVRQAGRYLGSTKIRGPLSGGGKLKVPLSLGKAKRGTPLFIDFGAEVSSGCPNVDAVNARFTEVVIH